MTKHDATHKLSQALAHILLAEKKALELPISETRCELLHFIREVKYNIEITGDSLGKDLTGGVRTPRG